MRRSRRATAQESNWSALGIPEPMPPIRRQTFIVNKTYQNLDFDFYLLFFDKNILIFDKYYATLFSI